MGDLEQQEKEKQIEADRLQKEKDEIEAMRKQLEAEKLEIEKIKKQNSIEAESEKKKLPKDKSTKKRKSKIKKAKAAVVDSEPSIKPKKKIKKKKKKETSDRNYGRFRKAGPNKEDKPKGWKPPSWAKDVLKNDGGDIYSEKRASRGRQVDLKNLYDKAGYLPAAKMKKLKAAGYTDNDIALMLAQWDKDLNKAKKKKKKKKSDTLLK